LRAQGPRHVATPLIAALAADMTRHAPPPVIDSARVVSYAFVDDIAYQKSGALYSGGKLVEHVPRLAISINLGEDIGPMLLHCDEQWSVLGTSGAGSVEQVKRGAEKNYPGVSSRWFDVNTSVEDALRYYDSQVGAEKCSFCGRRPFELERWVEGNNARICSGCVERFRDILEKGGASA
jgi:hypothetical protein